MDTPNPFLVMTLAATMVGLLALALTSPALLLLSLVERYGPCHGERPSVRAQARGIIFQVVGIVGGGAAVALIWPWLPHFKPIWPALALPVALLISDVAQYWEHRIEHWVFWRVHSVHHSTREMTSTSNFSHFLHQVLMSVIYGLPMSLVCADPMGSLFVIVPVYWWGAITHTPAKIELGWLRWLVVDNRMHRIHHSVEPQHFERNFGSVLSVWDRLFGTFYAPGRGWPATGVRGNGEIVTISGVLLRPFLLGR